MHYQVGTSTHTRARSHALRQTRTHTYAGVHIYICTCAPYYVLCTYEYVLPRENRVEALGRAEECMHAHACTVSQVTYVQILRGTVGLVRGTMYLVRGTMNCKASIVRIVRRIASHRIACACACVVCTLSDAYIYACVCVRACTHVHGDHPACAVFFGDAVERYEHKHGCASCARIARTQRICRRALVCLSTFIHVHDPQATLYGLAFIVILHTHTCTRKLYHSAHALSRVLTPVIHYEDHAKSITVSPLSVTMLLSSIRIRYLRHH